MLPVSGGAVLQNESHERSNPLDEFLAELTRIARAYGFGINHEAEIFIMEQDDFLFAYGCNKDGQLERL